MWHYGHGTSKRTTCWSNSPCISKLCMGTLTKKQKATRSTGPPTTTRYVNAAGKRRFRGNKANLKASQQTTQCPWSKDLSFKTVIFFSINPGGLTFESSLEKNVVLVVVYSMPIDSCCWGEGFRLQCKYLDLISIITGRIELAVIFWSVKYIHLIPFQIHVSIRVYPMRFALKLVQLTPIIRSSKRVPAKQELKATKQNTFKNESVYNIK